MGGDPAGQGGVTRCHTLSHRAGHQQQQQQQRELRAWPVPVGGGECSDLHPLGFILNWDFFFPLIFTFNRFSHLSPCSGCALSAWRCHQGLSQGCAMSPQLNFGAKCRPRSGLTPLRWGSAPLRGHPGARGSVTSTVGTEPALQSSRSRKGLPRACAELPLPLQRGQAEPTWQKCSGSPCVAAQEEHG